MGSTVSPLLDRYSWCFRGKVGEIIYNSQFFLDFYPTEIPLTLIEQW